MSWKLLTLQSANTNLLLQHSNWLIFVIFFLLHELLRRIFSSFIHSTSLSFGLYKLPKRFDRIFEITFEQKHWNTSSILINVAPMTKKNVTLTWIENSGSDASIDTDLVNGFVFKHASADRFHSNNTVTFCTAVASTSGAKEILIECI